MNVEVLSSSKPQIRVVFVVSLDDHVRALVCLPSSRTSSSEPPPTPAPLTLLPNPLLDRRLSLASHNFRNQEEEEEEEEEDADPPSISTTVPYAGESLTLFTKSCK